MTPFGKFIRKVFEKTSARYYEGPEPPKRIEEHVFEFEKFYPNATREEWRAFATRHASNWYREGYMRGFEHAERHPDPYLSKLPPEFYADQQDPNWRWKPVDLETLRSPLEEDDPLIVDLDTTYAHRHGIPLVDGDDDE